MECAGRAQRRRRFASPAKVVSRFACHRTPKSPPFVVALDSWETQSVPRERSIAAMTLRLWLFGLLGVSLAGMSAMGQEEKWQPGMLFILAGQSNMVGRADAKDLPDALRQGPLNVRLFAGSRWTTVAPGKQFGPEIAFAHEMAKAFPQERIGLVKVARGGTSLWKDWAPDNADKNALYPRLVAQAKLAMKASGAKPAAMLWVQGGSDATSKEPAEAYERNLKAFIARVRGDLGCPDLPFICGKGGHEGVPEAIVQRFPFILLVRQAMANVAKDVPHVHIVGTEGLGLNADQIHYDAAGQIEL
ncbi:MAG: sialate O-acetylesterase, partial [Planctomycetes bacterium]|nr:sialate O-acetylesterase [Planctomycetota bacterium]